MNIETKSFDFKATVKDEGKGILHAIVSVFGNEDSVGDVMVKGAFAQSIKNGKAKGKLPPGVLSHNWERPIAKTNDAWEDDEGLNIVAQFNLETQDGADTYSNVKHELFTEYSFGFGRIRDAEEKKDGKTYVKNVDWYEWSPVLVGANRETYTVGVKHTSAIQQITSERQFEKFLRDAGYSKSAAVTICVSGFKALHRRDAEEGTDKAEEDEPDIIAEEVSETQTVETTEPPIAAKETEQIVAQETPPPSLEETAIFIAPAETAETVSEVAIAEVKTISLSDADDQAEMRSLYASLLNQQAALYAPR